MSDRDVIDTLIAEAYAEGPEGMRRVAETIINRAALRGLTLDQVVRQPKQYTGYEHPGADARKAQQSPNARKAAEAALALALQPGDPTGGADHYLNPRVAQPSWAKKLPSTGSYGNHQFFASRPIPPGEIPNTVGTFLDTVRMPPQPSTQSASVAFRRQNTSPLGDNTALPAALQQYATRKANQVTPAIRRPSLPAMGTPNVNSLYAGIYPQQNLTSPGAVEASVRSTAQDPTLAAALARRVAPPSIPQSQIERGQPRIGQSIIDRGAVRIPPSQGNLTDPGAINASVGGLTQNAGLQAALARSIASPQLVPQSMIERGTPRIGQSIIERGVNRLPPVPATQSVDLRQSRSPLPSPIGQPPATRVVQSVSVPGSVPQRMAVQDVGNVARPMPAASKPIPQSYAGQETGAPRAYAPTPLNGLDRLPASAGLPEAYGNAAIGGADIMRFGVPATQIAPVPAVRPASFTTQIQPTQVLNPAWSATPAAIPAGTPMSGGLSRDAVALRAKGLAQAQAMANVPKYITVNRPVQVPVRVPAPVISQRPAVQAPILARPAAMLSALTTMNAPLGYNISNASSSAMGRPTANVGQVYGVAANGGMVTQGHNGLLNSITQDSAAWRQMTDKGGSSSGRSLSTESGQRSFME